MQGGVGVLDCGLKSLKLRGGCTQPIDLPAAQQRAAMQTLFGHIHE
jgi:hypothetical protein